MAGTTGEEHCSHSPGPQFVTNATGGQGTKPVGHRPEPRSARRASRRETVRGFVNEKPRRRTNGGREAEPVDHRPEQSSPRETSPGGGRPRCAQKATSAAWGHRKSHAQFRILAPPDTGQPVKSIAPIHRVLDSWQTHPMGKGTKPVDHRPEQRSARKAFPREFQPGVCTRKPEVPHEQWAGGGSPSTIALDKVRRGGIPQKERPSAV